MVARLRFVFGPEDVSVLFLFACLAHCGISGHPALRGRGRDPALRGRGRDCRPHRICASSRRIPGSKNISGCSGSPSAAPESRMAWSDTYLDTPEFGIPSNALESRMAWSDTYLDMMAFFMLTPEFCRKVAVKFRTVRAQGSRLRSWQFPSKWILSEIFITLKTYRGRLGYS